MPDKYGTLKIELEPINGRYRARVLDTDKGPIVDVREYVESEKFTGWTPKGIRLNREAVEKTIAVLQESLNHMNGGGSKNEKA